MTKNERQGPRKPATKFPNLRKKNAEAEAQSQNGQEREEMTGTSPHQQLDGMITGYWISQAIYAAAKFNIAGQLRCVRRRSRHPARPVGWREPKIR